MRKKLLRHLICIGLAFAPLKLLSQQANYKYNNFGNRSILLSGNVTGSVSDIGLVYYNPARLTSLENTGFAFNAKAYQLNSIKLTTVLNEEQDAENKSFSGVPSMAGGTFRLFGERFGYSFISRRRTDLDLSFFSDNITDNILEFFPDAENYRLAASARSNIREEWYGLTWARQVNDNLSLGISAFATSIRYDGRRSISHTIQVNPEDVAYYILETGFKQRSYGFNFKIGAHYKLNDIDLGLNINMPYLEVIKDADYAYNEVLAGSGDNASDVFYDYRLDGLDSNHKEPFGISVGAGIPIKRSKIHLNVDFVSGLSEFSRIDIPDIDIGGPDLTAVPFNEERKSVINFGIGGELYIAERFKSFFGFSTDFNGFKENSTIFDLSTNDSEDTSIAVDYYHLSGGIDWKMSWANIILGITYATGSTDFNNPFQISSSGIDFNSTQNATLKNRRYQAIIGLEIPLIQNTLDKFNKKKDPDKEKNE